MTGRRACGACGASRAIVLIEGEAVDDGFEVEGEQSEEIIDVAGFFQVPLHGLVEHGAEEREVLVLFGPSGGGAHHICGGRGFDGMQQVFIFCEHGFDSFLVYFAAGPSGAVADDEGPDGVESEVSAFIGGEDAFFHGAHVAG